jgi:hypothetical protein
MADRICSIPGCRNEHAAKGLCDSHYARLRRHGDPLASPARGPKPGIPAERFWAKVYKDGPIPEHRPDLGPCWLWRGFLDRDGYGIFPFSARELRRAPRFAHELVSGPIPAGLEVDHLCRNRGCVKAFGDEHGPAHTELVTHAENMARGVLARKRVT